MRFRSFLSRVISLFILFYAVGYAVFQFAASANRMAYYVRLDVYEFVAPITAGLVGVWLAVTTRHGGRVRKAGWLLLAAGALSWAAGEMVWTYSEWSTWSIPPVVSAPDVFYGAAYPLLIAGVFLLFGSIPFSGRARLCLDAAVLACGVGALTWYYIFRNLWSHESFDPIGRLLVVGLQLGDLIILFGALILVTASGLSRAMRYSFMLLALGLAMFSLADTVDAVYSVNGVYHTGLWTDAVRSFGWLAMTASFLKAHGRRGNSPAPHPDRPIAVDDALRRFRGAIAPYVLASIASFVTIWHDYALHGSISLGTAAMGFAILLLVIARQMVTYFANCSLTQELAVQLGENEALNTRLEEFNQALESEVARRYHQLNSLQRLTREMGDCETVETLAEATVENTRRALFADATVIWLDQGGGGEFEVYFHTGFERHAKILALISSAASQEGLAARKPVKATIAGRYLLIAPLVSQGQIIGAIGAASWGEPFDADAVSLIESIGVEVGAAIDYACKLAAAAELVQRDAVTGVLNHCALQHQFADLVTHANEAHEPLAAILLDINNFTLFNNTYGHQAGDTLLSTVAGVLVEHTDPSMCVGRYGSDEFLIIIPGATTARAIELAIGLRNRVATLSVQSGDDPWQIPVSLSMGVASLPDDANNRHELMAIIHRNLFSAKALPDNIASSSGFRRRNRELRDQDTFSTLDAIVTAIDNKDSYTRNHSEDVTEYAIWIAEKLDLDEETRKVLRIGGLMHDVGKIGIPAEIIAKPGRLTEAEYDVMKTHTHLGWLIVKAIPGMEMVLDAIRSHHERWDGKGYPDGLRRDQVPIVGRILAVADAFSAMTTDRPYRKGMDLDQACAEVRANIGTQFDPEVANAFLEALAERRNDGERSSLGRPPRTTQG
ncbi:MAG: diguanylate cyclase [Capsulimonadaceae bacterium]|nr:diguanylate cyclase [Capsulimonadaceae bacterium]